MSARLIRRLAVILIALYAFGQASVALAGCEMDRGSMVQVMAMSGADHCDDCTVAKAPTVTVACSAHCTADLQLTPAEPAAIPGSSSEPLLRAALSRFCSPPPNLAQAAGGKLPRRILLHSFQI